MVSTIWSMESQLMIFDATIVRVTGPISPGPGMYIGCSTLGSTKYPVPLVDQYKTT